MLMRKIPVILDGDPGHDDAIAWTLAASSPRLEILAVTTVAGNVSLDKTTLNSRKIWTLLGSDVTLAQGASKPLFTEHIDAPSVHGESGLDGPDLPDPKVDLHELNAVDLMAKILREAKEPVTIVPTGPLTNVALLLLTYPELKEKIAHICFMGGGLAYGNWTPAAEFNILVDPEAAYVVFHSGLPLTMCGLDVTEQALVKPADIERMRRIDNPVARIVAEWLDFFYLFHKEKGYAGAPVHDAVAVIALTNPEILTKTRCYVDVELAGDYCRAATVADRYDVWGQDQNMNVVLDIDREKFIDLLCVALESYGEVGE
ncbi:MAG: nucleoside hydrolase [Eubacteriales bacterium]|nr:nucleoside hydrolase [Eubacteriales bacterium]